MDGLCAQGLGEALAGDRNELEAPMGGDLRAGRREGADIGRDDSGGRKPRGSAAGGKKHET